MATVPGSGRGPHAKLNHGLNSTKENATSADDASILHHFHPPREPAQPARKTETISARARTRAPAGTGAGKRILLSLYELSDEAQQDDSNGPSPLLQLFGSIPIEPSPQGPRPKTAPRRSPEMRLSSPVCGDEAPVPARSPPGTLGSRSVSNAWGTQ